LRAALPNGNGYSRLEPLLPEASYELASLQENGAAGGENVCTDFLLKQQNDMVSKVEVLDTVESCPSMPHVALKTEQMPQSREHSMSGHERPKTHQAPGDVAPPTTDVMKPLLMPAEPDDRHHVIGTALREAVEPLRRELAALQPAANREPGPKKAALLNLNEARMLAKEEFASALKQEQALGPNGRAMPPLAKLDDSVQLGHINGS